MLLFKEKQATSDDIKLIRSYLMYVILGLTPTSNAFFTASLFKTVIMFGETCNYQCDQKRKEMNMDKIEGHHNCF